MAERRFRSLCVYCGSSNEVDPRWLDVARAMGTALAARGIDVVFGGGHVGLMGAVADAALAAGGRVHGVIPEKLFELELAHEGVTTLEVVRTMHERKLRMAERSDGFVALPGGFGTLEEIFEATTWTQLGYHDKPVGLLNAHGFYDGLLAFLEHAAEQGFVRPPHREMLQAATEPGALIERLATCRVPTFDDLARRVRR
ncbi:MAG: TIGR00730 family Rossman fold protein [Deltaproteobacteria bacterium]|nr:TIGR00730 family Rossman fold protein [Deltaproteobacteria bacterium]